MKDKKLPIGTVMILHAVARGAAYGFDIMEETGLTSGTVYPALDRMESHGLLASSWEDAETARADKRPPRRYFTITEQGKAALVVAMERYKSLAPVVIDGLAYPGGVRPA